MKCPICKQKITVVQAHWNEKMAVCDCGVRPYREYKEFEKTAVNPFERWEI